MPKKRERDCKFGICVIAIQVDYIQNEECVHWREGEEA